MYDWHECLRYGRLHEALRQEWQGGAPSNGCGEGPAASAHNAHSRIVTNFLRQINSIHPLLIAPPCTI